MRPWYDAVNDLLRILYRIAGSGEGCYRRLMDLDVIGMAVASIGTEGHDHLRAQSTHQGDDLAGYALQGRLIESSRIQVICRALHARIVVAQQMHGRQTQHTRSAVKLSRAQGRDISVVLEELGRIGTGLAARCTGIMHCHTRRGVTQNRAGVAEAFVVGMGVDHEESTPGGKLLIPDRLDTISSQIGHSGSCRRLAGCLCHPRSSSPITEGSLRLANGSVHRGAMRMAPSRRIVSPLSITFSTICCTSAAYSSGRPSRGGNGTCCPSEMRAGSGSAARSGVSKMPGAMLMTRMPWRANSRASGRVRPAMPAFDAL